MMKNHLETLPAAVAEMAKISLTGNIVPTVWFQKLTFDNGKPDLNSILILADLCYWHRPSEVRDERSGAIIGYKKKFAEDLLRKSYSDLQTQFGLSDRQLRDCFSRLENRGVIRRVFRTKNSSNGRQGNVMYIELFPSVVKELTHGNPPKPLTKTALDPINMDSAPYHDRTGQGVTSNGIPITLERDSYHDRTGAYIEQRLPTNITPSLSSGDSRVEAFFAPKKKEREEFSNSKKMLEVWNQLVPEKAISGANSYLSKQLEAALRDQLEGDLSAWKTVCEHFPSSKFLMGEVDSIRVKPDLSWLVDPKEPRVNRVFTKTHYTFGDRNTETKPVDFDAVKINIQNLDESFVSKQLRLFVCQKDVRWYWSWIMDSSIEVDGKTVFINAGSGFKKQIIDQVYGNDLREFLKERFQLGLVIQAKEEEASHALKE